MDKRERIEKVILYSIFIFYILLLVKLLFLSRVSLAEPLHSQGLRSINLIPFNSIMEFLSGGTENLKRFAFSNLVGNIIIFIPLGICLPLLKKDKRVFVNLLFIFIASLFAEVIQGILGIGTADIDDIILNCLGGLLGILGYKFLLFLLRDENKVHTIITILSVLIGLPILLYLLFIVRLRL
jgi:glycopeptide antibiotics resistance protein